MVTLPISVKGSPSNAPSGIKVCPDCRDQTNPQAYLSVVSEAWGADPQTLIQPRPQQYKTTYALGITLPNALYNSSPDIPITLPPGFAGRIQVNGILTGAATAAFNNPLLTVNTFAQTSMPSLSLATNTIDPSTPAATYLLQVTQPTLAGEVLSAQLAVA